MDEPGVAEDGAVLHVRRARRLLRPRRRRRPRSRPTTSPPAIARRRTQPGGFDRYGLRVPGVRHLAVRQDATTCRTSCTGQDQSLYPSSGARPQTRGEQHRGESSCVQSCTTVPARRPGKRSPSPTIVDDTDAIVRVDAVTICGTDLHILKGDVPAVTDGRILGHEAVGTVESVGAGVKNVARRRPRPRVVHHRLRRVPLLPGGPLRPVPRWRRLDPRPQDRRHPGRVRTGAVRRHVDLPRARRRGRRGQS